MNARTAIGLVVVAATIFSTQQAAHAVSYELRAASQGKVRLLAQFHDFQGWDLKAMWDDVKFSTTHCTKIERIALVGEKKWEEWMARVCKPFTMAKIQYFDAAQIDDAWRWLRESR